MGLLITFLIVASYTQTIAPVWVTSNYIRAGNANVINSKPSTTGEGVRPSYTLTFTSSLSAMPQLGYGIKNYQGDDFLVNEQFQVLRASLSASDFTVEVEIFGITNIYILNVAYIAIDPDFPHHLNSFDNVPVSEGSTLTNISSRSYSPTTYTNTINYTQQAASRTYKTFSTPLTNNKIVLFLTSIRTTCSYTSSRVYYYWVNTTVLSTQQYSIYIYFYQYGDITQLHFSELIFDVEDVERSYQYVIETDQIDFDHTGGFLSVPQEFIDNFIMGIIDWSAETHLAVLHFKWTFNGDSSNHGIDIDAPVPADPSESTLSRQGFSYFYIKTWYCPSGYGFDTSTNLCYVCTLSNCIVCGTPTTCVQCDEPNNYYDNSTQLCELCSLQYCLNCSSLTTCRQCDTNQSYYLVGDSCAYCNGSSNSFINPDNLQCQSCSLLGCLTCSDLSNCVQCDESAGYFLDTNTSQCVTCPVPGCTTCSNISTCSECDFGGGYELNEITQQCATCQSNFFINSTSKKCEQCDNFIENCLVCSTTAQCSICDYNLSNYVVEVGQEPPFNVSKLGLCDLCNSSQNYFINLTNYKCQLCSLNQCLNCSSLETCIQCNEAAQFFLNISDDQCVACPIANCLTCQSISACLECNHSAGYELNETDLQCIPCEPNYFINDTTKQCAACSLFIPNCITCSSETLCSLCDYNASYHVVEVGQEPPLNSSNLGLCEVCNSSQNYYINSSNYKCQLCSLNQCLNCSSLETCVECNQTFQYYLNVSDDLCVACPVQNCVTCRSINQCQQCNQTALFFLNYTDFECHPCSLEGCINCSTLYSCYQCNESASYYFSQENSSICGTCNESCQCDGYYLPYSSGKCTSLCGDGYIVLEEECDDNNTQNGDGCSQQCQVENVYACFNEPSECYLQLNTTISFSSIEKVGCNSFTMELKVDPKLPSFAESKLLDIVFLSHANLSQSEEAYDADEGIITIDASYKGDITNRAIEVVHPFSETLSVEYDPLVPPMYYTEEECQSGENAERFLKAVEVLSYFILFSCLLNCKIVGLELFGVLQLAFIDLAAYDFININLSPLLDFKSFNGVNVLLGQENNGPPQHISQMGIYSSFLNNFNVMYLLIVIELFIGLVFRVVAGNFAWKLGKTIGSHLLKEGFLTFLMFSALNVGFSAGIHWKYAHSTESTYIFSSIGLYTAFVMFFIMIICLQATSQKGFGEFKNKFKDDFPSRVYISLSLIYRLLLGIYISTHNDYELGVLLIIGLSMAFILYNISNLPFSNVFQSYRANIMHISHFIILMVANYYRSMKSTTPTETKAHLHTAAQIELVVIGVCVVVSLAVLVYELVNFFKMVGKYCSKKKSNQVENEDKAKQNQTQHSFSKNENMEESV